MTTETIQFLILNRWTQAFFSSCSLHFWLHLNVASFYSMRSGVLILCSWSVIQQHLHLPTICLLSRCSPDWHSFRAETSDYFHLFPFSLLDAESLSNVSLISFVINVSIPQFFLQSLDSKVFGSFASRWPFPDNFPWIYQQIFSTLYAFFVLADSIWLWCRSPDAMFQVYCTGQWFSTTTFTQAACQADVALNDMLYDEATRQSSPLRYRTAETSQGGGCSGIRTEPIRALGFRPHASCAA